VELRRRKSQGGVSSSAAYIEGAVLDRSNKPSVISRRYIAAFSSAGLRLELNCRSFEKQSRLLQTAREHLDIYIVEHSVNEQRSKCMQPRCEANAVDPDKKLVDDAHTGLGAIQWNYDRAEIIADGVVHALGITLGLGASVTLLVLAEYTTFTNPGVVAVYAVCLLAMLVLSAAYNLCPVSPLKWLFRRLDQSAIYLLIAATYTPFISQLKDDGNLSTSLLIVIWFSAVAGIVMRMVFPDRFDIVSIVLYVAMGWSGIIAYDKATASLPISVVAFIAAGGILYTVGVIFHLWEQLRYQNAIWHSFVLLGAACHFTAVLDLISV
jgi:hemolysin III